MKIELKAPMLKAAFFKDIGSIYACIPPGYYELKEEDTFTGQTYYYLECDCVHNDNSKTLRFHVNDVDKRNKEYELELKRKRLPIF